MTRLTAAVAAALLAVSLPALAQAPTPSLDQLSLQDLLDLEVTTVARKQQTVARTAAAVYVITAEEIRRSGAATLPDVLRLAPGVSVQQLTSSQWSVTVRGYGGLYANKLLVLVDGRSIYSALNGGVLWEAELTPVDSIERVEVVRGPGGSLWGANAINGVINVITRNADATQGTAVIARAGTHDPGSVDVTHGGRAGDNTYYRGRVSLTQRQSPQTIATLGHADAIENGAAGGRVDWNGETNRVTIAGNYRQGQQHRVADRLGVLAPATLDFSAGNARVAWTSEPSGRTETGLQAYYSFTDHDISSLYRSRIKAFDVDGRVRHSFGRRHDVVMGAEYRYTDIVFDGTPGYFLSERDTDVNLVTAFIQDEITLGRVALTPGLKIEHSTETGANAQPTLRALWTLPAGHMLWGATSRVVRTPNLFDRDLHVIKEVGTTPTGLPIVISLRGNPDFSMEIGHVLEGGYRWQRQAFAVDVALFRAYTHELHGERQDAPRPGAYLGRPALLLPITFSNDNEGLSFGGEASLTWRARSWWRVTADYAHVTATIEERRGSVVGRGVITGAVPPNQYGLRNAFTVRRDLEVTGSLAWVGDVPQLGVDAYTRLDLTAGWTVARGLTLNAGALNLLRNDTPEFRDIVAEGLAITPRRELYVGVTWRMQ